MSKGNIKTQNLSGTKQSTQLASFDIIFRDQHKEKSLEYHNIQRKCKGNNHIRFPVCQCLFFSGNGSDIKIIEKCKSWDEAKNSNFRWRDTQIQGCHSYADNFLYWNIQNEVSEVQSEIAEQFSRLPGRNGFYLKLIVGDLNLTLPTNELKRKYKEDYEKWKLNLSFAILGICWFLKLLSHEFL